MKYRQIFLLICIVVLSFGVRFFQLSNEVDGFYRDEASVGYNAYSLAKTNKDEYGRTIPFLFEALEDFKLPVVIYTAVPWVYFFGLEDFWVRFSTAFFGSITPLIVYLLAKRLFSSKVGLLSAFSIALSPWHILFSRSVNESVISVLISTLGIYFLIKLFDAWSIRRLVVSIGFLILALFTYRTQIIFAPIFLILFLVIYRKKLYGWSINAKIFSFIGLLVFFIIGLNVLFAVKDTRYKDVGLPQSVGIKAIQEEQIREDSDLYSDNLFRGRIFHNKVSNLVLAFADNYVKHFDFSYLFFHGDFFSINNSIPHMGYILIFDLPFLLIGIYSFLRGNNSYKILPIVWIIISPIASSLTVDSPNSLRNLISTIGFSVLVGYGLYITLQFFQDKFTKKLITILLVFLYIGNLIFFIHLFMHRRVHRPWYNDQKVREMISYSQAIGDSYRHIVYPNYSDMYIFLLYYGKIDPSYIQEKQQGQNFLNRKVDMVSLINPNYSFMDGDCIDRGVKEVLYICVKRQEPKGFKVLKIIPYTDSYSEAAFTFLTIDDGESKLNY